MRALVGPYVSIWTTTSGSATGPAAAVGCADVPGSFWRLTCHGWTLAPAAQEELRSWLG